MWEVHITIFFMVESANPVSFRSMVPPACKEWDPIKYGSIPLDWRLRYFADTLTAAIMPELWTYAHCLLSNTSQMRFDSDPLLLSMWCTCQARAVTAPFGPVISWWIFYPVRPFFCLIIFKFTA